MGGLTRSSRDVSARPVGDRQAFHLPGGQRALMHPYPVNINPSGCSRSWNIQPDKVPGPRAGAIVTASPESQRDLVTLHRFQIHGEHARSLGFSPGDEILVDTSTYARWNDEEYDSHVVLARSPYGYIIGRYHHLSPGPCLELLDSSDDVVQWIPEMKIMGVICHLSLELSGARSLESGQS